MKTRKQIIESLLPQGDEYFMMFADPGVMYFKNTRQITEAEYHAATKNRKVRIEKPLFFDAETKKRFNLKTFDDDREE